MKKYFAPLALFIVIGAVLVYALYMMQSGQYSPRTIPSPFVGKPLPSFAAPTLQNPNTIVTTDSLKGRVYVLNIWASWCAECRVEHPVFNEVAKLKLVPIIGLNHKDKRDDALNWLNTLGNPYEQNLVDAEGRIGIELGLYGVPETFVVDKDGIVRLKHIGAVNAKVWNEKLLPVIQQLI